MIPRLFSTRATADELVGASVQLRRMAPQSPAKSAVRGRRSVATSGWRPAIGPGQSALLRSWLNGDTWCGSLVLNREAAGVCSDSSRDRLIQVVVLVVVGCSAIVAAWLVRRRSQPST